MAGAAGDVIDALDALAGRKFAVVDAAHVDDLPGKLEQAGFAFRPLYLDEQKDEVAAAGPFLVPLPDRKAGRRLSGLIGDKPAIVWWSWPDRGEETQEAIFRHLRTINMAEIPAGPADPDDPAIIAEARAAEQGAAHMPDGHDHAGHDHAVHAQERYDLVLFRHGDPNVMAMLLPLLDFGQVSRLFGEATGIVVDSPDAGGVRAFPRPENLPERPKGWLRIQSSQNGELGNSLRRRMAGAVAAYLQKTAPPGLGVIEPGAAERLAGLAVESGAARGLSSEAAHCRWAYLLAVTGGRVATDATIATYLSPRFPASPDDKIRRLMQATIERLRDMR